MLLIQDCLCYCIKEFFNRVNQGSGKKSGDFELSQHASQCCHSDCFQRVKWLNFAKISSSEGTAYALLCL